MKNSAKEILTKNGVVRIGQPRFLYDKDLTVYSLNNLSPLIIYEVSAQLVFRNKNGSLMKVIWPYKPTETGAFRFL